MELEALKSRCFSEKKKAIINEYLFLQKLLSELQDRELPPEVIFDINLQISRLNAVDDNHNKLNFYFKLVRRKVLKKLSDDLDLVPKNYYRNLWLSLGSIVFGLPLGVIFSILLNNTTFIAIGLPFGLLLGIVVGLEMDRKAIENNNQLELKLK